MTINCILISFKLNSRPSDQLKMGWEIVESPPPPYIEDKEFEQYNNDSNTTTINIHKGPNEEEEDTASVATMEPIDDEQRCIAGAVKWEERITVFRDDYSKNIVTKNK